MISRIKLCINTVLLVLMLLSCNEEQFTGSGNVVSVVRDLGSFTAIEANNALEINVIQAPTQRVEVTADDNLQNRIRTRVLDEILVISLDAGSFQNATFIVTIQVPDAARITLNDASRADIILVTDQLDLVVNDASDVMLEGSADFLNVNTRDAAMVSGFSFSSGVVNVMAKGASVLEITSHDELNGEVKDAARVFYKGNPEINVESSDSGRVVNSN